MRFLFSFCFVLGCYLQVNAQQVTGIVIDETKSPISNVTVSILKAKDSTVAKLATTNSTGTFAAKLLQGGMYVIQVSSVGYTPFFSNTITIDTTGVNVGTITLKKQSTDLTAVNVTAKKPLVEVKADKMILNVEGTINATGNDGMELLRKAPGVTIDNDDNISLAGKNGVVVFIDGKPSPLAGADLAAYLRSLQAIQIESIELITTPGAKYEAAGNAGIINIKLKKNKTVGTNGTVNAGIGYSFYTRFNGGLALNHRNKKFNVFTNYNYSVGNNRNTMNAIRVQGDTTFEQHNIMKNKNLGTHNFKTGLDYYVNEASTLGVMVTGNYAGNEREQAGPLTFVYNPTKNLVKYLETDNKSEGHRRNINLNLNYRYTQKSGKDLSVDADYGYFDVYDNQFQPNYYKSASGVSLYNTIYRLISPTYINLYSLKTDYEQSAWKGKIGIGFKSSFVNTDNQFERYDVINNVDKLDKDRSNTFYYKENINAVYGNYNRNLKTFNLQVGLRVEQTSSNGRSKGLQFVQSTQTYIPYDSVYKRSYVDFFPSFALTFNKNPKSVWSLTGTRRIDRPAYQDLNPFEFKLNDYTYRKGNTRLKPQYTNTLAVGWSYKNFLNTQLSYSHVKDIFTMIPDTTEKSKTFMTKNNLASQNIINLTLSFPYKYKFYSLFFTGNAFYSAYKADFGGGDRVINQDIFSYNIYLQNTFNLGKGYTADLSASYQAPLLWQGLFKSIAMRFVDVGLQKNMFKNKATLKVAVTDIFKSMKWGGTGSFTGLTNRAWGEWESRQLRVNFTYRFGNNQLSAKQRKSAVEDENKRTQGGGNSGGMGGN